MPIINLTSGDSFDFNVSSKGKYLLIRASDSGVVLGSDDFRSTGIQTGDAINVSEFDAMRFENPTDETLRVEYQVSDLPISTNATQNIEIQRIIEPIEFEATVKLEDGLKVEPIAPTRLNSLPDKEIQAGQTVKVTSNETDRKQTVIQVHSDNVTLLRIGGVNVNANTGAILSGSVHAMASTVIDSSADVYLHNTASTVAKVSVTEVLS
ncbi:hypothetical protein ABXV22_24440 [Vibrio rotiferianus]|uniref:hypothetical protein n=1 Tax=Vibrio rotiferianus TaxID=190895 RepID=UPI003394BFB7